MRDDYDLTGKPVLLNVLLRGSQSLDGTPRLVVFGFAINLPPDLMGKSGGKDVHLVAECRIVNAGSAPCDGDEWRKSVEDILEDGLPAFKSHKPAGRDDQ